MPSDPRVADEHVTRAMRTFESLAGPERLRYPEAQKWHLRDIMAMRRVLEEFAALADPAPDRGEAMRGADLFQEIVCHWAGSDGILDTVQRAYDAGWDIVAAYRRSEFSTGLILRRSDRALASLNEEGGSRPVPLPRAGGIE